MIPWTRAMPTYIHEETPSVVVSAVSTVTTIWINVFQNSLFFIKTLNCFNEKKTSKTLSLTSIFVKIIVVVADAWLKTSFHHPSPSTTACRHAWCQQKKNLAYAKKQLRQDVYFSEKLFLLFFFCTGWKIPSGLMICLWALTVSLLTGQSMQTYHQRRSLTQYKRVFEVFVK